MENELSLKNENTEFDATHFQRRILFSVSWDNSNAKSVKISSTRVPPRAGSMDETRRSYFIEGL